MNEETLLTLAKHEGRLPLDMTSNDVDECYRMFERLMESHSRDIMKMVTSLQIPSSNLSDNSKSILSNITKLTGLTSFSFAGGRKNECGNKIKGDASNLPQNMSDLKNMVYLDLNFNTMDEIPSWIFSMKFLQRLQLNFCGISSIQPDIKNLPCMKELHLKGNLLETLPQEFSCLTSLKILNLSSNKFRCIPASLNELNSLEFLDLSENGLCRHFSCIKSHSLEVLKLRSNNIPSIDDTLDEMPKLKSLDLRFNCIRKVSSNVKSLEFVLLDGNPIGYRSPEKDNENNKEDYDVPKYHMDYDTCCMKFEAGKGGEYILPCGAKITLSRKTLKSSATLFSHIILDNDVNFALDDMDELLSGVLELSPNGLKFEHPVKVSLPYTFERHDQQIREVVIRVVSSDGSIEDLETVTESIPSEGGDSVPTLAAVAFTSHFSLFGVVARLVQTSAVIQKDRGQLLFSSAYPQTKLKFLPDSVNGETKITMKVIAVDPSIVEEISNSSTATASCVLSVHVSPPETVFQKPVTVHLALPDQLLGKSFNHSDLRLLKCVHGSCDWLDVTDDTTLHISSMDVKFQVQSFSKFLLVTEIICGVARVLYRRLRTHKVQFLAMQKRSFPTQVLTQCVLESKISSRIEQLNRSGYIGEDVATQVQELVEGDVFKIKVIGDLKIQTYNQKLAQHIQEKLVLCKFFSQYPPDKKGFSRFFIESKEEEKKCHTGYVSFYKVDSEQVEEKASMPPATKKSVRPKRKSSASESHPRESFGDEILDKEEKITQCLSSDEELDDENHLGDIPIVLENDDLTTSFNNSKQMELDFGGLGTGMFREENLRFLACQIGNEWREIGTFLGIPFAQLDRITADYPGNMLEQIFRMLKFWANVHKDEEDCIEQFTSGLSLAGRNDLVTKVKSLYEEGKREFQKSVKRKKGIQVPLDWKD